MKQHLLPPLPYEASALEPYVDMRTMVLHHDMHHAAYVKALNFALESAPTLPQGGSADWLLLNLIKVPEKIRTAVCHNAGGHVNHSLLWRAMSPDGGGAPSGPLAEAIDRAYGCFDKFKAEFEEAAGKLFGSGWIWLVQAQHGDGKLKILTTSGHDNPLVEGYYPLIVNDLWEHAYYLKHENRRNEYLHGWWSVVNWQEAARRFERFQDASSSLVEPHVDARLLLFK
jgi:Fe-Mn family superoxide dismutase